MSVTTGARGPPQGNLAPGAVHPDLLCHHISVRLKTKQIQLDIILCSIVSVG
jgi:hypothetical protein